MSDHIKVVYRDARGKPMPDGIVLIWDSSVGRYRQEDMYIHSLSHTAFERAQGRPPGLGGVYLGVQY